MRNTRPSISRPTASREVEPPKRIVRSLAEKIRIVEEYDAYAVGTSERGALLRREGLYTSHIAKWRKLVPHAHEAAAPTPQQLAAVTADNERLRQEVARLQARLSQAETVIDVQQKVAQLLGAMQAPPNKP